MLWIYHFSKSKIFLWFSVAASLLSLGIGLMTIPIIDFSNSFLVLCFAAVLLLMPFNWYAECRKLPGVPFEIQWKTICKGISMNIWLPFGIGTYLGRWYQTDEKYTSRILDQSIIGSLIQNLINLISGLCFFVGMMYFQSLPQAIAKYRQEIILGILIYFFVWVMGLLVYTAKRKWFLALFRRFSIQLENINFKEIFNILAWSFLRYIIYHSQFCLLLMAFGYGDYTHVMACVAIIFMLQSAFYLPSVFQLVARGGIAALVLSFIGIMPIQAAGVSWLIYWINLGFPAFIGTLYMVKEFKNIR